MATRLRERPVKVKYKCPRCGAIHTATEWHTSSIAHYGRISRRLPYGRGSNYCCPSCGGETPGSRIPKVIYNEGKEVDGFYYR